MTDSLAIVIPAYKAKYFDAALLSIAGQSNKNFKVYVSDDGSKENIKSIVDKYTGKLNIAYHRFDENAGRSDLIKHWDRSVMLAHEEWVWLFSDDDMMAPGCVQAFYDAVNTTAAQYNVYRFNIEMIDADDRIICVKAPHPELESGFDFLKRRLQSKSLSAAAEYIFKKESFEKNNGFINFPLAFCSDDASWIAFAGNKAIYTIPGHKVCWRASGINISSANAFANAKARALLLFVKHIIDKYPSQKSLLLTLANSWFFENLGYINGWLGFWDIWHLSKQFDDVFEQKNSSLKKIMLFQFKRTRLGGKLYKQ